MNTKKPIKSTMKLGNRKKCECPLFLSTFAIWIVRALLSLLCTRVQIFLVLSHSFLGREIFGMRQNLSS